MSLLRRWVRFARLVGVRDALGPVVCNDLDCGWQGRYWHYPRHRREAHRA